MKRTGRAILLTVEGETKSLCEWSTDRGISYRTLLYRVRAGWTPEQVVCVRPGQAGFRTGTEWSLRERRASEVRHRRGVWP